MTRDDRRSFFARYPIGGFLDLVPLASIQIFRMKNGLRTSSCNICHLLFFELISSVTGGYETFTT